MKLKLSKCRLLQHIDIFDKYQYFKNIDIQFLEYREYRKLFLDNLMPFFLWQFFSDKVYKTCV